MARKYHAIWRNEFLSSDTIANLEDYQIVIFLRLLLVSDDWGRFPDNPMKLKRMASDFSHDIQQYSQTVTQLTVDGCIERYEVNGDAVCQFNNWDKYFVLTWKDDAQFPNVGGVYERSNNPGATGENKKNKSKIKTTNKKKKTKLIKSNQIKAHDSSSDSSNDKKVKHLESVYLKNSEYQKLVEKYTKEITDGAIEILNNYKMANGKKYKSDYHAMINWVIDKAQQSSPNKPKENPF